MTDKIKAFWDNQAKEHGASDLATAPDHYYREKEIAEIIALLRDGDSILDVGCGNGYSTLQFAKACPSSPIIGVDYSKAMIEQAIMNADNKGGISFVVGNILDLVDLLPSRYDTIVCTRCLINLDSWHEQQEAILQIKHSLKPGGRLILVENTLEGLVNLNNLRRHFDLPLIEQRWHNHYLPQTWLEDFLADNFTVERAENIGSTYYLISRGVYAKISQLEGREPQYDSVFNKIAADLPNLGGGYSPNMLYVCRKQ
jgi:ubiquinone/menaquinone biosynthesis C-methylase UbiE